MYLHGFWAVTEGSITNTHVSSMPLTFCRLLSFYITSAFLLLTNEVTIVPLVWGDISYVHTYGARKFRSNFYKDASPNRINLTAALPSDVRSSIPWNVRIDDDMYVCTYVPRYACT